MIDIAKGNARCSVYVALRNQLLCNMTSSVRTRDPACNTIVTQEFLFKYEELVECQCEFAVV